MPIYEYQCRACGQVLDALQKFSDAPLKKCPSCGKSKLKRLLSAPMFLLKGSGWYETDFKSDKERRKNLADRPEPDAKSADGKADAPAEAKADAKPEDKKTEKAEKTEKIEKKESSGTTGRAPARKSPKPKAKPRSRRR